MNNAWVKYRLPNENKVFEYSGTEELNISVEELKKSNYFIYSLFEIPFGIHGFRIESSNERIGSHSLNDYNGEEINREDYINRVEEAIQLIKNEKMVKIVYSRFKFIPTAIKPQDIFDSLCNKFPNAFVYLLSSPKFGMWCGASPEVLVQEKNNVWQTMALAGTRCISENQNAWSEKDIAEQDVVVREIRERLEKLGLNFSQGEKHSKNTGTISHLCTEFEVKPNPKNNIIDFIKELHPTPAVCGLPRISAYEQIKNVENITRELYTGIIGSLQQENDKNIFVNLRCMRIFKNGIRIHAGGGLNNLSNPILEWEETEIKMDNILKKII